VTGPGLPAYGAVYARVTQQGNPVSDLIAKVDFKPTVSTQVASSERLYETSRDLTATVINSTTTNATTIRSAYSYAYDALGRKEHAANAGEAFTTFSQVAFSDYGYNDRNELIESERRLGTPAYPGALVQGQSNGYSYDPTLDPPRAAMQPERASRTSLAASRQGQVGNRVSAWIDTQTPTGYVRNPLNQYDETTEPAELLTTTTMGT